MLLFALHFTQFVLVLEIAWCSLAVMLLLGKGKNVFENKKGGLRHFDMPSPLKNRSLETKNRFTLSLKN